MKQHLKQEERREIRYYLDKQYRLRQIAELLGRSVSTISDEIRRNSVNRTYDPEKARQKSRVRRKYAKYQGMRVVENPALRTYLHAKIEDDWSPELIAGRVRTLDTHLPRISTKGIYRYIHSVYGRRLEQCLRYGQRKKLQGYTKKTSLHDRVFIDERAKTVERRLRFGDYEADFIESGRNGSGYLVVLIERKSRMVRIRKILQKTEAAVFATLKDLISSDLAPRSLTLDNDIIFRNHARLAKLLNIPIFFTHPYHAWEKGQVEQVNKLIRQYIPKGSNISRYPDAYLAMVAIKLNTRPRACLQFQTPAEVIEQYQKQFCVQELVVPIKKDPLGCSV